MGEQAATTIRRLLADLGAGVEMIPAHRHPRQAPGRLRQGLRADDPGDVVAAVADIEADTWRVAHNYFGTPVIARIKREGEKGKREKGEKGRSNKITFMG